MTKIWAHTALAFLIEFVGLFGCRNGGDPFEFVEGARAGYLCRR
jgi:hypothetical protein